MVIQIDDAGWGDLVGGCLLGFFRKETGEYVVKLIDVTHFRPPNFDRKTYLKEALTLAKEALEELKVSKEEEIEICTGSVLSEIRLTLMEEGYKVKPTRIEGKLQELIENSLLDYYAELGVPREKLSLESGRDRFYALINWVMEDFESREKYVKTGWKSWDTKWKYWRPKKKRGLRKNLASNEY
ncbi:MAG: hypothetical protein KIH08_15060 [Candidatus Freyarchaeota archaeon]|nr:hypothetical protein [Candidatus Jordarchaeia archaeon]MBS7269166.1 hypothetical protein [Candidatus Jordarchaeia archaeon]MBS7279974.1 hypothetical protein [Candidatus Jordarchaeia archaeon]